MLVLLVLPLVCAWSGPNLNNREGEDALSVAFGAALSPTTGEHGPPSLDNGIASLPEVDCMEDRVRLTFKTQKAFRGRIFVKGMVDNDECVNSFATNTKNEVHFDTMNGQCNMRRTRKLGSDREQRGMEQSITIIISFHNTFITKVDRAYRCTCFYMEADKVVTSRFDVSMMPTTDLIDTARMPLCTYSVRRDSVDGAVVQYAAVGETVYHVWQCESDMFGMLVHSCFVDDGNGHDQKPLLDEHGCTIDREIVPDLTYNKDTNQAYAEVSVFKFADKVSTYFQCAVSTCMLSDGMCNGKTPPRCGPSGLRRMLRSVDSNRTREEILSDPNTVDLSAQRITVLDLEEDGTDGEREAVRLERRRASVLGVCVGAQAVGLIASLSVLSLVLSVAIAAFALFRRTTPKF